MTLDQIRKRIMPWVAWWRAGWIDAWERLPKPAVLQTPPRLFRGEDGSVFAFRQNHWAKLSSTSQVFATEGQLINDRFVLFRTLHLPPLSRDEIASAVTMELRVATPFPLADTLHGYGISHTKDGNILIELAICRREHIERVVAEGPVFARGEHGPILIAPRHLAGVGNFWYRDRLTLSLLAALLLLVIAMLLSPLLLLRAETRGHEIALQRLSAATAPLVAQREELALLQRHLENAEHFAEQHPDMLFLLEQLSQRIPDQGWVEKLAVKKNELSLNGQADNTIAIISAIQTIPGLREVRLGSRVARDPRSGKETFQIDASITNQAAL